MSPDLTDLPFREARETATGVVVAAVEGVVALGAGMEADGELVIGAAMVVAVPLVIIVAGPGIWLGIASEEIMAAAAAVAVAVVVEEAEVVIPVVSQDIWLGTVPVQAAEAVAVAVAVVITVVIMGTWLGIALWKAAALVGSVVAAVEAVEGLVAVAVDATTVDRKGILLENALTLTHRDEGKRGVIVYILFFPASSV